MTLPPLPEPLVMVNRYGQGASTSDGDGGVFTAAQMTAYAIDAVLAEREACAKLCETQAVEVGGVASGPLATDKGKLVHEAMAAGSMNCSAAIRARATD